MYSNRLVSLDSRSLGVRIWTKFGKVWRAVDPRCCNNSDFFRSAMQFRCSLIGLEATTSRAKEERENVLVYSAILTMLAAWWLTFGRTFFWRWSPIRGIGQSVPRDRSAEGGLGATPAAKKLKLRKKDPRKLKIGQLPHQTTITTAGYSQ